MTKVYFFHSGLGRLVIGLICDIKQGWASVLSQGVTYQVQVSVLEML